MSAAVSSSETWADRRTAVRRQPAVGTVFRFDTTADRTANFGLVWNISTSGISMLVRESHERGDTLRGNLITLHGEQTLPVAARVSHIRKIGTGDYFLGAQFDRRLADHEIRTFLSL